MKMKREDRGKEGKRKRRSIRRENEVRKRGSFEERSQVVCKEKERKICEENEVEEEMKTGRNFLKNASKKPKIDQTFEK